MTSGLKAPAATAGETFPIEQLREFSARVLQTFGVPQDDGPWLVEQGGKLFDLEVTEIRTALLRDPAEAADLSASRPEVVREMDERLTEWLAAETGHPHLRIDPTRVDDTANDVGTNWCGATSLYGASNHGTPGTGSPGTDRKNADGSKCAPSDSKSGAESGSVPGRQSGSGSGGTVFRPRSGPLPMRV